MLLEEEEELEQEMKKVYFSLIAKPDKDLGEVQNDRPNFPDQ